MKKILIGLVFAFFGNVLQAQQDIAIAPYLPVQNGDSLFFQNMMQPETPPFIIAYSQSDLRKQLVINRVASTGSSRFEVQDDRGFQVVLFRFSDKRELLLDEPIVLLPPTVIANRTYRDTVRYTLLREGTKQEVGSLFCEAMVEGFVSAETPLRNFANCLVVSYRFVQRTTAGLDDVQEMKEWYAKEIGLVKAFEKTYKQDVQGKKSQLKSIAISLQKAYLGGQWLEGKQLKNEK